MKWTSLFTAFLAIALAGCGDGAVKQSPDQLKARLDAAIAISQPGEQNQSLKAVAEDAAASGVGDVAKSAVEKISNPNTKDDVAATCAKLAKGGDVKGATAIAQLISNPGLKNEVLGKISKAQ